MENNNNLNSLCGWVKLYHPNGGVQVTLPVPVSYVVDQNTASMMLSSVAAYLQAGWLPNQPGLGDGETKEKVTHLVRREKTNGDGSKTPLFDVYCGGGSFRTLGVYLNTQEDIKEFEKVFGPIDKFPIYDGDTPIERGKKPERDRNFVIPVRDGVNVVWRLNPRYEGEEDKKNPKRLFVRWEPAPAASAPAAAMIIDKLYGPEETPRVYLNGERVNGNEAEQKAYDSYLSSHGKAPASRDALRQWVKNNH
ncbi:MAG: hypothetical protein HPY45_09895 [Anaerolineae bacterium]|nr:hypothetical protein [Anaerolineae bacterium]